MIDKKKLIRQISKMEIRDWKALIILIIMYIPGKIYKIFNKDVWVITEYENYARDNGYWLFKYIRNNYPDIKVYYPISSQSPDYNKIKSLGNIIRFGGIKHYLLFWGCNKFIGTTKYYGFPYGRICEDLVQWNLHGFKNIFLNHGVARGYSSIVDGRETNYDLIFALSPQEKEIMIKENYQNQNIIKCMGFCRHDNLDDRILKKNRILIMPTWRNWLDSRLSVKEEEIAKTTNNFLESDYYNKLLSLLNNNTLIKFLNKNNLEIIFYLHEYAQCYSKHFYTNSNNIIIATNQGYDIQELLKSSCLLITDYSSVTYDFAYMYKPLLYYQFDLEMFEENQYAQGENFCYEKNGFGEIVFLEDDLVDKIIESYNNKFIMEQKFIDRVNAFFIYHDKKNCERIFNTIQSL